MVRGCGEGSRFLPVEPAELELSVVGLSDGSYALGVVLRAEEVGKHRDITAYGGWKAYRE